MTVRMIVRSRCKTAINHTRGMYRTLVMDEREPEKIAVSDAVSTGAGIGQRETLFTASK